MIPRLMHIYISYLKVRNNKIVWSRLLYCIPVLLLHTYIHYLLPDIYMLLVPLLHTILV